MTDIKFLLLYVYADDAAIGLDSPIGAELAKVMGAHLPGVDVLLTRVGFGHWSLLHARRLLDQTNPLVIAIVDQEKRLRGLAFRMETRGGIEPTVFSPTEALFIDEQQQVSA